jgi:hypothetical protein
MFGKKPPKDSRDMTDQEVHDRLGALRKNMARVKKYSIPASIALGAVGVALAAAGGLGLVALPLAPMTLFGIFAAVAPMAFGLAGTARASWEREVYVLSNEVDGRLYVANRQQEHAARDAAKAEHARALESAKRLREEFDAALKDMQDGRGIRNDIKVKSALRFKAKALTLPPAA